MAKGTRGGKRGSLQEKGKITGGGGNSSGPLTDGEKEAIEYYVSGEGMWMNDYEREEINEWDDRNRKIRTKRSKEEWERNYGLSDIDKETLKDMDTATNRPIGEGKTLYRSVDARSVFGDMNNFQYENLMGYLMDRAENKNLSISDYIDSYYGKSSKLGSDAKSHLKDTLTKAGKGKRITDKGYMSTATNKDVAFEWDGFTGSDRDIVLKLTTGKNTRGLNLHNSMPELEKRMGQSETILHKGSSYTIDHIGYADGHIVVYGKLD